MEFAALMEIVSGARELAASARVEGNLRGDRRRARQIKELIDALRKISSHPEG